jgi:hypothetical protein
MEIVILIETVPNLWSEFTSAFFLYLAPQIAVGYN